MKLFTRRFYENFKNIEKEFTGKPTNYLEIGVFLGYTAEWVIDNVLTHSESRYYGIDPWIWFSPLHRRFHTEEEWKTKMLDRIDNLRIKYTCKAEFIKGYSQEVLMQHKWVKNSFDLIYVDGNHTIVSVLRDWVLTWPLLKVGGVMMFDDYLQRNNTQVKEAVDVIMNGLSERKYGQHKQDTKIELLWKNFAVGIRKIRE
jgi:predicted O-methyltransferase YrrM